MVLTTSCTKEKVVHTAAATRERPGATGLCNRVRVARG